MTMNPAAAAADLALYAIADAQRAGGVCTFIDGTHTLDIERARGIGIDLDALLVSQPDSIEQAIEIAGTLVLTGAIDLIALDLPTPTDDRQVKAIGRLILAASKRTTLMFVNGRVAS